MAKEAVTLEIGANDKGLVNAMRRSERQVAALEAKLKSAGRAGKRAGAKTTDSWMKTAAQFLTVGAGINAVINSIRKAEQVANEAATRIRGVAGSLKDLIQLSADPADFIARQNVNRQLRTQFGFGEQEARDFSFQITSAGLPLSEVSEAGRLRKTENDPQALAVAAVKLRNLFGEQVFGGSLTSIVSTLGLAGTKSQKTAGGIAELALGPLALGAQLGMDPESVLAGTAFATRAAETSEIGRTQFQAFLGTLLKSHTRGLADFRKLGYEGSLDVFFGLSEEDQAEILGGRKEGIIGAGIVRAGREEIRGQAAALRTEGARRGGEAFFARKERLADTDPRLLATLELERAEQRKEIATEASGVEKLQFDAIREEIRTVMEERDIGYLHRAQIEANLAGFRAAPGFMAGVSALTPAFGETAAEFAAQQLSGQVPGFTETGDYEKLLARFLAVVEQSSRALERMNRAADRVGGGAALAAPNADE